MPLVVITTESLFPGETSALNSLFEQGLRLLYLRKPGATEAELRELLTSLRPEYLPRVVLHDHFPLAAAFPVKGVHLNRRHPEPPPFPVGSVSRSCHRVEELQQVSGTDDYAFLSPIFDSLSKAGYRRGFTPEALLEAKEAGLINEKVYALGGIEADKMSQAAAYGFGGVAVLGALWDGFATDGDTAALQNRWHELQSAYRQAYGEADTLSSEDRPSWPPEKIDLYI